MIRFAVPLPLWLTLVAVGGCAGAGTSGGAGATGGAARGSGGAANPGGSGGAAASGGVNGGPSTGGGAGTVVGASGGGAGRNDLATGGSGIGSGGGAGNPGQGTGGASGTGAATAGTAGNAGAGAAGTGGGGAGGGAGRGGGGAAGSSSSSGGTTGSGGAVATGGSGPVPVLVPGAWGDQGDGSFKNPFMWADYNNLDVTGAGGAFYMIAASHHYMGMPVLRSSDMVNWSLVARIYRRLTLDPRYDTPGQAYQHGTWAPAIRHHEGRFWVYVATPVEGLIMTTATDAAGPWDPWTVVMRIAGWEDPCPFWDDVANAGGDGPNGRRAYLVRSRLGAGPIIVQSMSWDGKRLLGTATTVATGPTLEGPKLHKRNGYYYIFAPEGGIDAGYQVVLRSRAILGPYEKRTILQRGTTATNGPHQGSWIDLPSGQSWFYHFQQNGGWGRIGHLQPARWGADDWPQIGVDLDGNGIGEPVAQPRKPDVGGTFPLAAPRASDEFEEPALGLQWLWNHNPDDTKWSLTARPGWLRLIARPLSNRGGTSGTSTGVPFVEDSIVFAYNTVVQLAMGRVASAVTKLDTNGMVDGQRAGITLFGQTYGWIGVVAGGGGSQNTVRANVNGTYTSGPVLTAKTVFLRASINTASQISFAYSIDGAAYTPLGGSVTVGRTWFEGIKFGLFSYHLSTAAATAGGAADFEYFRYTHDGPRPAP